RRGPGPDLEGDRGARLEDLQAVELGHRRDAVDLGEQPLELEVDGRALGRTERPVGGLDGELAQADQDRARLVERALRDLEQRDAVVRVALCLLEAADL